jgi:hypothetical protein
VNYLREVGSEENYGKPVGSTEEKMNLLSGTITFIVLQYSLLHWSDNAFTVPKTKLL